MLTERLLSLGNQEGVVIILLPLLVMDVYLIAHIVI